MQASDLHNILTQETISTETLQKLYALQEEYPYFQYLSTVICLKDSNQKNIQNTALRTVNRAILQNLLRSSFDPDHHRKHLVKYEIEEDDLNFIQKIKSEPNSSEEVASPTAEPEETTTEEVTNDTLEDTSDITPVSEEQATEEEVKPLFDAPEYEYPTFDSDKELNLSQEEEGASTTEVTDNEETLEESYDYTEDTASSIEPVEEIEAIDFYSPETEQIKQNIEDSLHEMEALKREIDLRKAEILGKLDASETEEVLLEDDLVQFEEPDFQEPVTEETPTSDIEIPDESSDEATVTATEETIIAEHIEEEQTEEEEIPTTEENLEEDLTEKEEKEESLNTLSEQEHKDFINEETNEAINSFIKKNYATIKSPSFFLDELIASTSTYKVEKETRQEKRVTVSNVTSEKASTTVNNQDEIISNFIKLNPGAITFEEQQVDVQNPDLSVGSSNYKGIKTEYLAKIFVSQGRYDHAIEIYQELSLKNPDKKSYFADLIEKLKKG